MATLYFVRLSENGLGLSCAPHTPGPQRARVPDKPICAGRRPLAAVWRAYRRPQHDHGSEGRRRGGRRSFAAFIGMAKAVAASGEGEKGGRVSGGEEGRTER